MNGGEQEELFILVLGHSTTGCVYYVSVDNSGLSALFFRYLLRRFLKQEGEDLPPVVVALCAGELGAAEDRGHLAQTFIGLKVSLRHNLEASELSRMDV